MSIPVVKGKQNQSVGRRLFSMAAPIVGGAVGGPAGAAAGSVLASKMNGASTQDAVMGGVEAGASSQFSRRKEAIAGAPETGISEGISVLEQLPQGHPLKQELGPGLIQASMMRKPKGYA